MMALLVVRSQYERKFAEWDWKEVQQIKDSIFDVQQHLREQGQAHQDLASSFKEQMKILQDSSKEQLKFLQVLSERVGVHDSQIQNIQMDIRSFMTTSMKQHRPVSAISQMPT